MATPLPGQGWLSFAEGGGVGIYAKTGASSRAAAALFAVQHGLLPEEKIAITTTSSPPAPGARR